MEAIKTLRVVYYAIYTQIYMQFYHKALAIYLKHIVN